MRGLDEHAHIEIDIAVAIEVSGRDRHGHAALGNLDGKRPALEMSALVHPEHDPGMSGRDQVDAPVAVEIDGERPIGCLLVAEADFGGDVDELAVSPGDQRIGLSVRAAEENFVPTVAVNVDGGRGKQRMAGLFSPAMRERSRDRDEIGRCHARRRRTGRFRGHENKIPSGSGNGDDRGRSDQKFRPFH